MRKYFMKEVSFVLSAVVTLTVANMSVFAKTDATVDTLLETQSDLKR